jgi:phage shock protein A
VPRDTTVRQRVIEYLVDHGAVVDHSGRATGRLKEAVGYQGGDAGFIRIVGLMADAGEIEREVRGKRTYRISVSERVRVAAATKPRPAPSAASPLAPSPPLEPSPAESEVDGEIDYEELAAALLARVARVLSAAESDTASGDQAAWARRRLDQLEAKVASLQRDLARARAEVQAVTAERDELREKFELATRNNDMLTERLGQRQAVPRVAERLDSDEQALLYRLRRPGRSASPTRAG